jgi:hypothetical protein
MGEWWRRWPRALISARTGIRFVLLDIDCAKHPEAALWLGKANLPLTRTHITRSGGRHLLFQFDDRFRCTTGRISCGVDTKGINGCAIWWPAERFEVLHGETLAPVPEWIIRAMAPPSVPAPQKIVRPPANAHRKIDGIIRAIAGAREGERNAVTFWGACRFAEMIEQSLIDRNDAIELVVEAASRAGLPRDEARNTAHSAIRVQLRGA